MEAGGTFVLGGYLREGKRIVLGVYSMQPIVWLLLQYGFGSSSSEVTLSGPTIGGTNRILRGYE